VTIRSVHDTITRLKVFREGLETPGRPADHLARFIEFGSNPGALQARAYIPVSLRKGAPLIVVLHGCTQTASGYDKGAGWSSAAEEYGFALLFPEQQRTNNPNLCFNWFSPEDTTRQRGEALSIRQMITAMETRHGIDAARVFITGLSAGGAMAAVMLAGYPEVFAGGAIIGGLPFGIARSVPEAFDRMRGHGLPAPAALASLVRSASRHQAPWPVLSVWHGTSDITVDPSNSQAIVDQWRVVCGLPEAPSRVDIVDGCNHRVWADGNGRDVLEEYLVPGMGHGTPLSTLSGNGENAAPFMLEAGISSTRKTLQFWGIGGHANSGARPAGSIQPPLRQQADPRARRQPIAHARSSASGIQKAIEDALRTAGLLR
jgi:poly(hydroxyalkanoate) depolymerase family esterase